MTIAPPPAARISGATAPAISADPLTLTPSEVSQSLAVAFSAADRKEAAQLIVKSLEKAIAEKVVTYDFARLMPGATQVSCSGFGQAMIERM